MTRQEGKGEKKRQPPRQDTEARHRSKERLSDSNSAQVVLEGVESSEGPASHRSLDALSHAGSDLPRPTTRVPSSPSSPVPYPQPERLGPPRPAARHPRQATPALGESCSHQIQFQFTRAVWDAIASVSRPFISSANPRICESANLQIYHPFPWPSCPRLDTHADSHQPDNITLTCLLRGHSGRDTPRVSRSLYCVAGSLGMGWAR